MWPSNLSFWSLWKNVQIPDCFSSNENVYVNWVKKFCSTGILMQREIILTNDFSPSSSFFKFVWIHISFTDDLLLIRGMFQSRCIWHIRYLSFTVFLQTIFHSFLAFSSLNFSFYTYSLFSISYFSSVYETKLSKIDFLPRYADIPLRGDLTSSWNQTF